MHVFARVSAAAAALVTALSGAAVPAVANTDVYEQTTGSLEISIGVEGGQYNGSDDLELTLSSENGTGAALLDVTAELNLTYTTIDTRFALNAWLDDEPVLGEYTAATVDIAEIPTGTSSTELLIEADHLGLGADPTPGVYGMRLTIAGASTSSVITVGDSGNSGVTYLSLAAQISAPPDTSGLFSREQLTALTSSVGSLERQLATVERYPISVGLDPMIETSVYALSNAPTAAWDWLERTRALEHPFHTQYAMSDVLAQLAAGVDPLLPMGYPDGTGQVSEVLPSMLSSPSVVDATTRAVDAELLASASEYGTPILSSVQLDEELASPTPNASVSIGEVQALASDQVVQTTINTAVDGDSAAERLSATNELIALLATISRESPSADRTLAATINPAARGAEELLETLTASGWVTLAPLDVALETPARAVTLQSAEATEFDEALIQSVDAVHEQDARVERYSQLADDPATIRVPYRLSALAALHVSGSATAPALERQVRSLTDIADDLLDSVRILPGSAIQIVGSNVDLPVELVNELAEDATVRVHIRTLSPIVVVDNPSIEVTIAAGSAQRVLLPVEVIGSGRTNAIVTLETVEGEQVGESVVLRVRAQPEVETVLLIVGVASVVLLVGFGFWRSLRKRRAGKAAGDLDAAGFSRHAKLQGSGES